MNYAYILQRQRILYLIVIVISERDEEVNKLVTKSVTSELKRIGLVEKRTYNLWFNTIKCTRIDYIKFFGTLGLLKSNINFVI